MRILFLTDNYPPEVNAPAVRTHFHCREWVRAGATVTVITGAPNFPRGEIFEGYRNKLHQVEEHDGVRVVRVWTYMAPNAGFLKRSLDFFSYAVMATMASLKEEFDLVVATSPQFFTALAGSVAAGLKGRPWVFELRDLWPESIVATGAMEPGMTIRILERLEMDLYRSSDLVVSVTDAFRRQLVRRGIPEKKIRVVTNGVDSSMFDSAERPDAGSDHRRPFTVGYLGTHGMAHGLHLVLETAHLVESGAVEFVLVGDGAEKERLQAEAARQGLQNVRFLDPVDRPDVPVMLRTFDAALIPLRDEPTFRTVIPSKIFEAAATRTPILLGVRGEAERLVRHYDAGLVFQPESSDELAEAIRTLSGDAAVYRRIQEGCAALASDFDRIKLAREMLGYLEGLYSSTPRS